MTAPRDLGGRRSAYRVRPDSVHELDLALLEKRYKVIRGKVADIAIGGVQVQFEKGRIPPLAKGERIMLALASDVYDFDGTMWASIVSTSEQGTDQVVRFSFDTDNAPLNPGDQTFFQLFNRRAKYRRIEQNTESYLTVEVVPRLASAGAAPGFPAAIRDISNNGVCFSVSPEVDAELQHSPELALRLQLPQQPMPRSIACSTRRRAADGDLICYGCEFDWTATPDSPAAVDDLIAYVVERFVQDLRVTPDRRAPSK